MPVNYFNEDPKSNLDIDKVIKKNEYWLTSDKISKIPNPTGNKILMSTGAGDMQESENPRTRKRQSIKNRESNRWKNSVVQGGRWN